MTALDEYDRVDRRGFRDDWGPISPQRAMYLADAAIDSLKCCGNCENFIPDRGLFHCYAHTDGTITIWYGSPCQLTPSRWQERTP